jgi:transposase
LASGRHRISAAVTILILLRDLAWQPISGLCRQRRPAYPSDLTDAQWALRAPLLRECDAAGPGRPPTVDLREIVKALLDLKQPGWGWHDLPHDLPPRSTVHYDCGKWTADGTGEAAGRVLREQSRRRSGRTAQPTAGIIARQTAKTAADAQGVGWMAAND